MPETLQFDTKQQKIAYTLEHLQQIYSLDTLGIHVKKDDDTGELHLVKPLDYPIGQYPTLFTCDKCGQTKKLVDFVYNPYTKARYCKSCKN